jgi:type 1 fimbria pilin
MKKFIMPAVIMVMATGAAFAAKKVDSKKAVQSGYRFGNAGEPACVITPKSCEEFGAELCTYNGQQLHQLEDSMCGEELFEIINP